MNHPVPVSLERGRGDGPDAAAAVEGHLRRNLGDDENGGWLGTQVGFLYRQGSLGVAWTTQPAPISRPRNRGKVNRRIMGVLLVILYQEGSA
jgi:hypothetical protein